MRENQEQSQVLRQRHMGQQAIAEVVKLMMAGQNQGHQPQMTTRRGPTVTEVEEFNGTDRNFQDGPSPHPTPPNNGPFGVVNLVPQVPTSLEMVQRL